MRHLIPARSLRTALVGLLALALVVVGGAVPAHAATETQITGRITAPPGVPSGWLSQVKVSASTSWHGPHFFAETIAADGRFTIDGLDPDKKYKVRLQDESSTVAGGWLREDGHLPLSWSNGSYVSPGGQLLETSPKHTSSMRGTLQLPEDFPSWDYEGFEIRLYPAAWENSFEDARIQVRADGTFELAGLPAGESYFLRPYHQWLDVSWVAPDGSFTRAPSEEGIFTADAARQIHLTAGPEYMLPAISGTVDVPSGTTRNRLRVQAFREISPDSWHHEFYDAAVQPDGSFFLGGLTRADTYRIKLIGGTNTLNGFAGPDGTWFRDVADGADFPVGKTIELHAKLAATLSGTIELAPGVVRGSTLEVSAEWPSSIPGRASSMDSGVQTDGSYRITGFFPGDEVRLLVSNRNAPAGAGGAQGYIGADGLLYPYAEEAAYFAAPRSGINTTIEARTLLRGHVELPAGFQHDAEQPPTVWAHYQALGYGERYWTRHSAHPGSVLADGSFAIGNLHPRTPYRLELVWPDGRTGFWTSDRTVTTEDAASSGTTTPRDDVFFPLVDAPEPAPDPAPRPEPAPDPGDALVTPKVAVKVLKAKSTRAKLHVRVKVQAPKVTKQPLGTLRISHGKTTRTVALKAKHRGKRVVTIPRTKPRGKVTVRYQPSGPSADQLTTAGRKAKVTKVNTKVKVQAKKRIKAGQRAKVTVRVNARITAKPTGRIRVTYGKKNRTIKLKARHRGKVTVRLPRLSKGKHRVRARYLPAKKWKPYVTAKTSQRITVRAR